MAKALRMSAGFVAVASACLFTQVGAQNLVPDPGFKEDDLALVPDRGTERGDVGRGGCGDLDDGREDVPALLAFRGQGGNCVSGAPESSRQGQGVRRMPVVDGGRRHDQPAPYDPHRAGCPERRDEAGRGRGHGPVRRRTGVHPGRGRRGHSRRVGAFRCGSVKSSTLGALFPGGIATPRRTGAPPDELFFGRSARPHCRA